MDARLQGPPFKVVDSERGPRSLEKLFDIVPPERGPNNIQSLCRYGSSWLLFHHGSTMQVYAGGELVREVLIEGELVHPNDSAVRGDEIIVCDAGVTPPVIKRVDPEAARVSEVYPIEIPGWRIASVAIDRDGNLLTVAVEDIALEERSQLLIRRYDPKSLEILQSFRCPTEDTYSQGCTVIGSFLYLNNNDGGAATTARVIAIDLRSEERIDSLLIDQFGETEGLDGVWADRTPHLATALRGAVYLVAAP